MTAAFPLHWPAGWPRASHRTAARFSAKVDNGRYQQTKPVTVAVARDRLQRELDLLGAVGAVLSTNLALRLDGQPKSGEPEPADPGAAVYFTLLGKPMALSCDRWDRVADNVVALAKHIEALRGMSRWGVGSAVQAFAGYQALPAPEQWWQVLGFSGPERLVEFDIESRFRWMAKQAHPDAGGSTDAMARLNAAKAAGLAYVNGGRA